MRKYSDCIIMYCQHRQCPNVYTAKAVAGEDQAGAIQAALNMVGHKNSTA